MADSALVVIKQSTKIDPLLEPLLLPIGDELVDEFLSRLIAIHAEPVIKGIIHRNIHPNSRYATGHDDARDIYQEIIAQLLGVLQRLREQPEAYLVSDIRGLIAIIAYRTCSRWMTRQFPKRHAFKNRLYYILTRQRGFALWQGENKKLMAGFALWQGQKAAATEERLKQ